MIKPSRLLVLGLLLVGCNDGPTAVGTNFDDAGTTDLGTPADRGNAPDNGVVADNGAVTDRGNATDNPVAVDTPVAADNGAVDAGTPDTGAVDAGTPDAGTLDAGTPDTGAIDAGTPDTGVTDAGTPDAGTMDAGTTDAGPTDAGSVDTGVTCTPAAETCNGLDDDCDGIVDELGCATHLLITEVVIGPDEGEYVEIHNPTAAAIDLANVYVSDLHDYACYLGRACTFTGGRTLASLGTTDFVARFPAGASLAPGAYATVAIKANLTLFRGIAGVCPTYYLAGASGDAGLTVGTCTASLPMRPTAHATNTIGTAAGLTNGQEPVVLFQWDNSPALPVDLDYVFWGTPSTTNLQVDKTTTSITLAAGGSATFLADTAPASQQRVTLPTNVNGAALVRCNYAEGAERRTGGNGLGGHDETSEPLATTWRVTAAPAQVDGSIAALNATPGAVNNCR
ncbi:MAG: Endo,4-beta-xylanase precursor [Myxococcaceae bacterium]|nr:Endo,4-beta-xylanase precursor [Myxococcaceae bacterium]